MPIANWQTPLYPPHATPLPTVENSCPIPAPIGLRAPRITKFLRPSFSLFVPAMPVAATEFRLFFPHSRLRQHCLFLRTFGGIPPFPAFNWILKHVAAPQV